MKKFANCEMKPGNVELRLNPGTKTAYKVFGWTTHAIIDGIDCCVLHPADDYDHPVMVVPWENISFVTVTW